MARTAVSPKEKGLLHAGHLPVSGEFMKDKSTITFVGPLMAILLNTGLQAFLRLQNPGVKKQHTGLASHLIVFPGRVELP
jgi:hypothetical protein